MIRHKDESRKTFSDRASQVDGSYATLSLDTFDTYSLLYSLFCLVSAYVDLQQSGCREKFTGPVESFNIACTQYSLTGSRQYFLFVVVRGQEGMHRPGE